MGKKRKKKKRKKSSCAFLLRGKGSQIPKGLSISRTFPYTKVAIYMFEGKKSDVAIFRL